MSGLTFTQAKAKAFIAGYTVQNGYSPSFDEIRDHMGWRSKSGAFRVVQELIERNHLRSAPGRARSLEVIETRSPMSMFSTEALIAELNRRGVVA